jgi:TolA-binding protein
MEKENKDQLKKVLRAQLRDDLKQELQQIEAQSGQKNRLIAMNRNTWFGMAAGIAIILVAYFLFAAPGADYQEIVAQNFEPMKNFTVPIERGSTDLSPVQEAFVAYEAGEYEKAVQEFDQLSPEELTPNVKLYQAIAQLSIDDNNNASRTLREIVDGEESVITPAAQWYLALTYLKQGKKNNAVLLFEELTEGKSNAYQKRAKTILEKL